MQKFFSNLWTIRSHSFFSFSLEGINFRKNTITKIGENGEEGNDGSLLNRSEIGSHRDLSRGALVNGSL